jgi:hypothetical protein
MREPKTPEELRCILNRLIDAGMFQHGVFELTTDEGLRLAVEEVVGAIEGAYVGESTPTPCQRLCGALFVSMIEVFVTNPVTKQPIVTIQEA